MEEKKEKQVLTNELNENDLDKAAGGRKIYPLDDSYYVPKHKEESYMPDRVLRHRDVIDS